MAFHVLILLALVVLASTNTLPERHSPRAKRELRIQERLSKEDLNAFWRALSRELGTDLDEFQELLKMNRGSIEETLDQFRDQLGELSYSRLNDLFQQLKRKVRQRLDDEATSTTTGSNSNITFDDVMSWFQNKIVQMNNYLSGDRLNSLWDSITSGVGKLVGRLFGSSVGS